MTHISAVTAVPLKLPLRVTFKHAGAARAETECVVVIVRIEGVDGFGECIPRTYLTGESIDSVVAAIDGKWRRRLVGMEVPQTIEALLAKLQGMADEAQAERQTAAWAGCDVAVVDAWARWRGIPRHEMLAGTAASVAPPLTAPIGLGSSGLWMARVFRSVGFRDFKLKVAGDASVIPAMRKLLGPDVALRVDYNGALTLEQARTHAAVWRECGVGSVEQPLPASQTEEMARLAEESPVPIMLDESLCTLVDAEKWATVGRPGQWLWNVRLAKVGGFSGARAMIALAEKAGIGWQLGALVGETGILEAAGEAALALGTPRHRESSFPRLLLKRNPVRKSRSPAGDAGLGVELELW